MIRNAEILRLHRPSQSEHDAFKEHFWGSRLKPVPKLIGFCEKLYGLRDDDPDFDSTANEAVRNDLISLGKTQRQDRLTRAILGVFPRLGRRRGHDREGTISNSDYRLGMIVGAVNVVVVAGLLFGAVFNLYYIKSVEKRLGVLAAYTIVFAAAVTFLSTATKGELFASTAAYAAVLVVFVSGGIGGEQ